jgi:hypothetical protein
MSDVRKMLAVLHYDFKWLDYQFIDKQSLVKQISQYENGVDENKEHYRYLSFCKLLDRSVIDDVMIDRFVELALLDEDQTMSDAVLAELVRHPGLTANQLSYLKTHPAFASQSLQNIVEQSQLLRELSSSELSDDLFSRCVLSSNAAIQRKLLKDARISKEQLQTLSNYGANRAIRNLATRQLGSRKS